MTEEIKRVELSISGMTGIDTGMVACGENETNKTKILQQNPIIFDKDAPKNIKKSEEESLFNKTNTKENQEDSSANNLSTEYITFEPAGMDYVYETNIKKENFTESQDEALNVLRKNLYDAELPEYGVFKTTIDISFVDCFGTSREDIDKKAKETSSELTELIKLKNKPIEFQRKYKEVTGTEFAPEKIEKAKNLTQKYQKEKAIYNGAKQVEDVLKENAKLINFVDENIYGTMYFRNENHFNDLKTKVLNSGAVLFGQKPEEFKKDIEEQFEKINGKKFSEVSNQEQAEAYYKILKNLTSKENLEKAKNTFEKVKSDFEKSNLEKDYNSSIEAAYGKNKLAEMIKKNQTQVEYTYQGVKIAGIIGTTILTGGAAGALHLGAAASIGATSVAAGLSSGVIDITEQSTDTNGLTKEELAETMKSAATTSLFTALGGCANVAGIAAKTGVTKLASTTTKATVAKIASSKVTQYAVQNATELATDVATSYAASKALGMDTTWSSETLQSVLPQFGFQILGGAAKRFGDAVSARKATNAAMVNKGDANVKVPQAAIDVKLPNVSTKTSIDTPAKIQNSLDKISSLKDKFEFDGTFSDKAVQITPDKKFTVKATGSDNTDIIYDAQVLTDGQIKLSRKFNEKQRNYEEVFLVNKDNTEITHNIYSLATNNICCRERIINDTSITLPNGEKVTGLTYEEKIGFGGEGEDDIIKESATWKTKDGVLIKEHNYDDWDEIRVTKIYSPDKKLMEVTEGGTITTYDKNERIVQKVIKNGNYIETEMYKDGIIAQTMTETLNGKEKRIRNHENGTTIIQRKHADQETIDTYDKDNNVIEKFIKDNSSEITILYKDANVTRKTIKKGNIEKIIIFDNETPIKEIIRDNTGKILSADLGWVKKANSINPETAKVTIADDKAFVNYYCNNDTEHLAVQHKAIEIDLLKTSSNPADIIKNPETIFSVIENNPDAKVIFEPQTATLCNSQFTVPEGKNTIKTTENGTHIIQLDDTKNQNYTSSRITYSEANGTTRMVDFETDTLSVFEKTNNGKRIHKHVGDREIDITSEITDKNIRIKNNLNGKEIEFSTDDILKRVDFKENTVMPQKQHEKVISLLRDLSPTELLTLKRILEKYPDMKIVFANVGISGVQGNSLVFLGNGEYSAPEVFTHELLHLVSEESGILNNDNLKNTHLSEANPSGALSTFTEYSTIVSKKDWNDNKFIDESILRNRALNELVSIEGTLNTFGHELAERAEQTRLLFPQTSKMIEEKLMEWNLYNLKMFGLSD